MTINRALRGEVRNYSQDRFMRYANPPGVANYQPTCRGLIHNETPMQEGGFASYPEPMQGEEVRARSESFGDHFSQATLFWNSMSVPEKEHIVEAFRLELGRVTLMPVQECTRVGKKLISA